MNLAEYHKLFILTQAPAIDEIALWKMILRSTQRRYEWLLKLKRA